MPRFVQVLKDTSPPLVWSAGWVGGSSEVDPALDKYSQATYTTTTTKGATMDFEFNGTFIGIYGAKRPDHGLYQVKLDGHLFQAMNAVSSTPLFNQTLFNLTVPDGHHKVTLINAGSTALDVDYIAFQGNIGKDSEPLVLSTFQDNDDSFTYHPPASWHQTPRPGTYSGSSGTITNDPNAWMEYKFNVTDMILLYGTVTPASAPVYFASVDNGPFRQFSAQKASVRPHQVLYYASHLGRGTHTLHIKFPPSNGTMGDFAIDFANLYSAKSLGALPPPRAFALESSSSSVTASSTQNIPGAFVAGLAISSTFALLGLVGCIFLLWRQRVQKRHFEVVNADGKKKTENQ